MLLTLMIVLVAVLVLAGFVFGFDVALNTVSAGIVFGLGIVIALGLVALIAAMGWIVVRDAVTEIQTAREKGRPWRWQCVGWIGIAGILVDGMIGAWNVYQQHILFSTAVEKIPFAGAPILVALASILVRLVEQIAMRNGQR